jgi:biotin carboxyl carrier protein
VSDAAVNALLGSVGRSWFSQGVVRVGDVRLEFSREFSHESSPAGVPVLPDVVAPEPAPVTTVRAPAPGLVFLHAAGTSPVERGDVLGHVQVHRKRVPVLAPASGRVDEVLVDGGTFAAYGDALCVLVGDHEAQSPPAQDGALR